MATAAEFSISWDLSSLAPHPDTPDFRQRFDEVKRRLAALAQESATLPIAAVNPQTVRAWEALLPRYEQLDGELNDLRSFLECHCAADAENKPFQQLEAEFSALTPLREQIATNIEFALKELGDAEFEHFVNQSSGLKRLRYFLVVRRRNAALRLPKDQEFLAAELAVDGLHAWGRLYDRMSGALRITVQERGKPVQKSVGQVQFDSPQRSVRENNFFAANAAWSTLAEPCAQALNHISGTRLTTYKWLGLRDHLEAPLRYNRMTRETLDTMWGVVSERKQVLKSFLGEKAKWLGLNQLSWYDLTAPLPGLPGRQDAEAISYDEACQQIVAAFQQFSGDLGDFARMSLAQKWIEAENRAGKRQGGFCTGFPTAKQSRIFMTFTESVDSMSTLSHELGHAYHSWVLRDEPLFLTDYPMNLAETASTFAEAVLGEHRLQRVRSEYERLNILEAMLSDAAVYCMNIHARFLFEDRFHQERRNGELSSQRFSELMQAAQQDAYQGALAQEGWNPQFWISKLHFYITGLPFYNFPYAFGYLLSLGLYALGGEMGVEFPAAYRRLLIATGNSDAEDAVQQSFGFDLRQPDFWHKSLDIIERRATLFTELSERLRGQLARI